MNTGEPSAIKKSLPFAFYPFTFYLIAVGTVIADRPPHRSVRAELPHTVLTVDVDMQTSRWDRGGGSSVSVANVCRAWRTFSKSGGGHVDCVVAEREATSLGSHCGTAVVVWSCPGQHNTDTSHDTHSAATRRPLRGRRVVAALASLSALLVWLGISSAPFCGGS